MSERDWRAWHDPYDNPTSSLSKRLAIVQRYIKEDLDRRPPGPIRAVSMCAGQGRDLIGALAGHPRRADVTARLVELDAENADRARRDAAGAGLDGVEVVTGDAAQTDAYLDAVPADLVLACGVFGNISDADIRRTVFALPQFCAPAATVIWTRHRNAPDVTPTVRSWFEEAGFTEIAFEAPEGIVQTVGVNRLAVAPQRLQRGERLFQFDRSGPAARAS